MVFLVHHHAETVRQEHRRAAAQRMLRVEPRQLLAHQMALVEQRPRRRRQLVQPIHHRLAAATDTDATASRTCASTRSRSPSRARAVNA